ncbi:MAG: transglutaminase family protein [Hyphomicrobiales bacterium]|nr:transglutaminase family protein [Hyphomicrobiales bacterium]
MLIRFGYEITVTCQQPTEMVCLLSVHPERHADIRTPETITTTPDMPISSYRDLFGNICQRFKAPAGDMTIRSDGVIEDNGALDPFVPEAQEVPAGALPDETLVYLMGSRYCQTDQLSQIAWDHFGQVQPGWGRVQAICDFVNKQISFDYMGASSTRGALEVYHGRIGVCRDYAHLAITFLRCMNIPARYVNGHLGDIGVPVVDPMDFSAWIEVYLGGPEGGRWHTFDPRNNSRRIGRIVVARGRDAADIPLMNSFGPHGLKGFSVWTYDLANVPATALGGPLVLA